MQDFRYVGLDISLKQRALGDIHFCFLSQLAYNSEILSKFAESFTRMKQKILERIGYSEHIERMFGRGMMIALTGQRRVGKSCVMRRISLSCAV